MRGCSFCNFRTKWWRCIFPCSSMILAISYNTIFFFDVHISFSLSLSSIDFFIIPLYLSAPGILPSLSLHFKSSILWIISALCDVPTNTRPQSSLTSGLQQPSTPVHFSYLHPRLPSRVCHWTTPHLKSNTHPIPCPCSPNLLVISFSV